MGHCCLENVVGLPKTVQPFLWTSSLRLKDKVVLLESKKHFQKEENLNLIGISKKLIEIKVPTIVALCGR